MNGTTSKPHHINRVPIGQTQMKLVARSVVTDNETFQPRGRQPVPAMQALPELARTRVREPDDIIFAQLRRGTVPRTLALVDVENMCGTPHFTAAQVADVRTRVLETVDARERVYLQAVIATSSADGIFPSNQAWPAARLMFLRGRDGADRCLLDVVFEENVASRFDQVVIASGDGDLTIAAKSLRVSGVRVKVIARPGSLSRSLAGVANEVYWHHTSIGTRRVA